MNEPSFRTSPVSGTRARGALVSRGPRRGGRRLVYASVALGLLTVALDAPAQSLPASAAAAAPASLAAPPASPARAEPATPVVETPAAVPRERRSVALRYDLRIDLPVTLTAGIFTVVTELAKPLIVVPYCRWCDRDGAGRDTLNGFDQAVRVLQWGDLHAADTLSNVTGYALAPLAGLGGIALAAGLDGQLANFPVDLLLVAEATSLAAMLTQVVKFSAMRERPFVHALAPEARPLVPGAADNNLSFFSGHSAITFSLAVSAGTVATMRGYRFAPLVWGLGLTVAATTAYLRIAAEKHYATDVLLGTAIGVGIGLAVPLLFHRPIASASLRARGPSLPRITGASAVPLDAGALLSLSGTF